MLVQNYEGKILVYCPSDARIYADLLRQSGCTNVHIAQNKDEAIACLPDTEILFCWKFPGKLLQTPEATAVKWVQSMGAGVDDLAASGVVPEHIQLTRVVDQFGSAIAEYVFAYLLHITQQMPRQRQAQAAKEWDPFVPQFLAGKTMGVAGLGSIGMEIVKRAKAFGMTVYGLSQSGRNASQVSKHFSPKEWSDFASEVDYLVLTLPATPETFHAVDRNVLRALKSDACLVNVGRGNLIDESDLIGVLQEGHLQAVVLDVFEQEPLPVESPLWTFPNVYVTPHLSGPSIPGEVAALFMKNLGFYQEGRPLLGVVDRGRGY
jgi:phosphoglycerate dehydrogenase-like enzyme